MMRRFLGLLVLIIFASCETDRLDVDVSKIEVKPMKFERFDNDFFALDTAHLEKGLEQLRAKYGTFTDIFLNNVICPSTRDSLACMELLRSYLHVEVTRPVWKVANQLYSVGFEKQEQQWNDALRYYKYHFPKRALPKRVFVVITGFFYNYIQAESEYGISLDYHLGEKNTYYDGLQWPMYKRKKMVAEQIVPGLVKSWMNNEFPYNPPQNDVINGMIYEGKILYLQRALLRNVHDTIIHGFTLEQLNWCLDHEAKMWVHLIEEKKLYSTGEEDIKHMTMDAPFTAGFPRESPGRAGAWLGYRIVEAFMNKHPDVTLEQLMQLNAGHQILIRSKYKPK
ncbi:MAG: hypothetical protein LW750_02245 [Bacteroidetes bacterium]|jgi:hypothetical protein|nr:hypothetical protein [Bacteroidota bacterium]